MSHEYFDRNISENGSVPLRPLRVSSANCWSHQKSNLQGGPAGGLGSMGSRGGLGSKSEGLRGGLVTSQPQDMSADEKNGKD
jgi:hypothetical protein